ncbi:hypothetical protein HNI00_21245 [Thermoleptolyngbya oregonensis NK1-22]|uniref:DUF1574 domain-containing protein n=1 Tax=Thermoleptolyngbya oregonensis NK1-22 TaxID=2547457 RepID=A0AA97BRF6_9CYAN|nr:hypothetical protein [Thermoleptolyngbya oregonensis]WOB45373.1 hypothetical protein HNI00_21245 [Thermoleptolyngbya oregonensis NK1-22]
MIAGNFIYRGLKNGLIRLIKLHSVKGHLGWAAGSALVVPLWSMPILPVEAFEMEAIAPLPPLMPLLSTVSLPPASADPPPDSPQYLPNFPSFNSQRLDHQIRLYSHYVMTEGTPDVLIIGSSRALQGIDPAVLRQALAERGRPNLRIYNFSINGATARVMDLVVRQVLPPDRLPRLIIWADGLRAFNSAKADVTFNGIASSAGYRQLAARVRTIPPEPVPASQAIADEQPPEICLEIPPIPVLAKPVGNPAVPGATAQASPPAPTTARSPAATTGQVTGQVTGQISGQISEGDRKEEKGQTPHLEPVPSSSVDWSNPDAANFFLDLQSTLTPLQVVPELTDPQRAFPGDALLAESPVCLSFLDPTLPAPSQVASVVVLPDVPANSGLRADGFEAIATQFNPATYYRQFPRVAGQYDSNYTPFQLTGSQTQATVALASYVRDRQIPLVFVSLPLTQDYLDPLRRRREQQFRQHMQQIATQQRFLFRDLSLLWPTRNQYFADPSHLNQDGAAAVARHLAQDPNIPWPSPQP